MAYDALYSRAARRSSPLPPRIQLVPQALGSGTTIVLATLIRGLWHDSRVIRPSLVIKDNEGQCTLCAHVRFIAGAENKTISIMKQFEAHCRKAHATARDAKIPTPTSTAAGD